MSTVDTAIAFLHPLAVIVLSCLWTLWILRRDYRPHLPEEQVTEEETVVTDEAEGV